MKQTMAPCWQAEQLHQQQTQGLAAQQPDWDAWSKQQLKTFLNQDLLSRKTEQWKYCRLNTLLEKEFQLAQKNAVVLDIESYFLANTHRLVFIDGHFAAEHSDVGLLANQVQLNSIAAITKSAPLDDQPFAELETKTNCFAGLNAGLFYDGLHLVIPKNIQCSQPIHLLHITTDQAIAQMSHVRHSITLEHNARCELFEEHIGLNTQSSFNNYLVQLHLKSQAHLVHYKLQREAAESFHIANTQILQEQGSQLASYPIILGATLARDDWVCQLPQTQAQTQLCGFAFSAKQQVLDLHAQIWHQNGENQSQQLYKMMAADRSRAVFNGKILVAAGADKTHAQLSNPNLLLSSQAEIDTKPEFEIDAEDVSASHGAFVGALDANALFYLQSRGIEYQQAYQLLIHAFANEVLEQLPNKEIAEHIKNFVEEKIKTQAWEWSLCK